MLILVSIFKLLAEIALLALLGQGVLALLAGAKREQNIFYQLLQVLTRPFVAGARMITPKVVLDRHMPLVAGLLLFFVWVAATMTKISICVQIGVEACK
ncbi:MAG: hypothetical protein Q8R33_24225 [Burkholderiales bacterium]|nr:hypothetical protein [Burkholderiales bacterium]